MKTDSYKQIIFSEEDLVDMYMCDPAKEFVYALVDKNIEFSEDLNLTKIPTLVGYKDSTLSIEEFDKTNQLNWKFPEEYKNFDIAEWVLKQCKTEEELQRVGHELLEFQKRDLFMLLRYLKYLVDTMRRNNIIWGVGRGSSVSSFVLYLIGVHRINSLYYNLSIDEFLK